MVIDSMVDEAGKVMRNAGVSDDVISRVQNVGHLTTSSHSLRSRKSYKEPDGLIVFEGGDIDRRRIALEVGFSQSCSSLRRATLWWIEQKKAAIAVMLCLTEVDRSSGKIHREFGTVQELNAELKTISSEFYRQRREGPRLFAPLEYNGYKWFGTLSDAFFETYRETDSGVMRSEPVYLVKDGVHVTNAIPRDLSVTSQAFMEGLSNAIVETALNRVEDSSEVRE
ncbi:uncharacterized protein V1513DRAFT_433764 [Lipomyces chichibuensis]|uniref:uncharacterized protein n=1 Tax=Lipomyces chichibuensis TaxID=1546026 RepID=UPI0033438E2F